MSVGVTLTGHGLRVDFGEIDENKLVIFQNTALIEDLFKRAVKESVEIIFNDLQKKYLNMISKKTKAIAEGYTDLTLYQLFENAFNESIITKEKIAILSISALMNDNASIFGGSPSKIRGRKWLATEQETITISGYQFVPFHANIKHPKGLGRHGEGFMIEKPGHSFIIKNRLRYKTRFINEFLDKMDTYKFNNSVMTKFIGFVVDEMRNKNIDELRNNNIDDPEEGDKNE